MGDKREQKTAGPERQLAENNVQAKAQGSRKKKGKTQVEGPKTKKQAGQKDKSSEISITRIPEFFIANEVGDAMNYVENNQNWLVSDTTKEEEHSWYFFEEDVCWIRDDLGYSVHAVESGPVKDYLRYRENINKQIGEAAKKENKDQLNSLEALQKKIDRRIERLRTKRGIQNVRSLARMIKGGLGVQGDVFDRDPYLLACGNGVVDLRSGHLRPGRSEDYIRTRTTTPYYETLVKSENPAPIFLKAVYQIFSEDWTMVKFVQKALGLALIGKIIEHLIFVLVGQGFNGKDFLIWCIQRALEQISASISAELLLDQGRARSSSSPSPDIIDMNKRRLLFASETDYGRHASPSRIKLLTGDGELVGRGLQDKELTRFTPSHTLFLLTNSKPHAPADDFAFWERMILIPFEISFVNREPAAPNERRQDPTLKEKVKEEIPGILAWLVQGCLLYQQEGLCPPPKVLEATAAYRRDEDLLADFIDDCCIQNDNAWVYSTTLYNKFSEWFTDNVGKKPFSHRVFGRIIGKKFEKKKYDKIYYQGIGLKF